MLVSSKESFDTSTATGKLLLTMIAAINGFERENLLERQREGLAIAKAKGKYRGRKKITRTQLNEWEALSVKVRKPNCRLKLISMRKVFPERRLPGK